MSFKKIIVTFIFITLFSNFFGFRVAKWVYAQGVEYVEDKDNCTEDD